MAFGALSFGGGYLTAPFERWFDVLRSPQISDAPDRAAQLTRYRHARARPGILRIWSTPRRPACSAIRYARNRAYGLRPPFTSADETPKSPEQNRDTNPVPATLFQMR